MGGQGHLDAAWGSEQQEQETKSVSVTMKKAEGLPSGMEEGATWQEK